MSATLSHSTRSVVLAALPPGSVGDDPTDDDLVRGLAAAVGALRAALVDVSHGRDLTTARREPAHDTGAELAATIRRALVGEPVSEEGLSTDVRRLVDEVLALRKRADDAAAALADSRQSLATAEGRGADRAREAFARTLRHAAHTGLVPDDLPAGPLRMLAEEVARLRTSVDTARAEAAEADKRAAAAERAAIERAKTSSAARREDRVTDQQARERIAAAEAELKQAQRERDAARRARELAENESRFRIKVVEEAERAAEQAARVSTDARAVLDLATQALDLPPSTSPEDVIARMTERLAATATTPATPPPPATLPPPEPPLAREMHWRKLNDGELALDRAKLRRLHELHAAASPGDPEPPDEARRVLVLRVGDRVTWLRGDGLWADGEPAMDAPAYGAGRPVRATASRKALVVAEGLTGEPEAVLAAWHGWLRAVEASVGLDAMLDDTPPTTPPAPPSGSAHVTLK